MKQGIDNNTDTKHTRNNTKAFEIFWSIVRGKQILKGENVSKSLLETCNQSRGNKTYRAIDLSQVAQSINHGKTDTSNLRIKVAKGRRSISKSSSISRPQTSSHEDQQHISRSEVVDSTNDDRAHHGEHKPTSNDETSLLRDFVTEECGNDCADESYSVNGDGQEVDFLG
jgi:hypothetical protein